MAHEILASTHPQITYLRIFGALTIDDMTCDEELGLNAGTPRAVLCDASEMTVSLPDGFLDATRQGFILNPNLVHLAVVLSSPLLRSVALMIVKTLGKRQKMTLHASIPAAEAHLLGILRQQKTDD